MSTLLFHGHRCVTLLMVTLDALAVQAIAAAHVITNSFFTIMTFPPSAFPADMVFPFVFRRLLCRVCRYYTKPCMTMEGLTGEYLATKIMNIWKPLYLSPLF
jgi:hypothetical protein